MSFFYLLAFWLASLSLVSAQTWSDCNPLKEDCPNDPALGSEHSWTFNETMNAKLWNTTNGEIDWTEKGAEFSIKEKLQSPTLQSTFYIFFGVVETHLKMAKGNGIVSSVVLQSDDLDEIDWEWIGSNNTEVQSNYFGKGDDSSFDRGGYHYVPDADTEFHNYTTYWDQDKLEWWIDDELVRTLKYAEAKDGSRYPQTPSNIRFGIWPAGDGDNKEGVIAWAGGEVDYAAGPYTMVIESVRIQDFHSGKEYEYTDDSGSWESINVIKGNSTAVEEINKPPPKSLSEKWDDLPTGAHAGVFVGAATVGAMLIAGFIFFIIRQRRKGRLEQALDDTNWNNERTERTEMSNAQSDWRQSEWRHKGYSQVN
ncbi:concanavalin A-like lectin/glucanase [Aspergillus campestris IBT 28561]|uniref:Crh-like protein n=1 Tax=Aspergillus campestris (strain IBT 28561) TaxID=1392248 RepID=A0A2I1DEJ3_ASPC2|nr:concanavalin A-like lectin/glucanase [Aspergillus campestris IBT 28561]PKY08286.1 concanavalin A-like lectin/glucanase [Aspergillus campestris IBT 28561]